MLCEYCSESPPVGSLVFLGATSPCHPYTQSLSASDTSFSSRDNVTLDPPIRTLHFPAKGAE